MRVEMDGRGNVTVMAFTIPWKVKRYARSFSTDIFEQTKVDIVFHSVDEITVLRETLEYIENELYGEEIKIKVAE